MSVVIVQDEQSDDLAAHASHLAGTPQTGWLTGT
jgi:hypothetical protein